MMEGVAHLYHMTVRDLRNAVRQPSYVLAALIQPVIWLVLFGQLLAPLMEARFSIGSYVIFLTPGVITLTALFASGWSGMVIVTEMDQGTLDRLLTTPVRHWALIAGRLIQQSVVVLAQSLVILLISIAFGARFEGGVLIMLVFLLCMTLCAAAFSAFSNALGLVTRSHQAVVAIAQLLALPLAFMSEIFVPREAMPVWMRAVADVNPVNWLVEIGRETITAGVGWGPVLHRACGLLLIALAASWLSARALRYYQRQV